MAYDPDEDYEDFPVGPTNPSRDWVIGIVGIAVAWPLWMWLTS